jgi:hypothetical protein
MGLKDKLGKVKVGGMEVGKLGEMYKVSQSPEVKQMQHDAEKRANEIDYGELVKTAQAAQAMGATAPVIVGPSAEQIAIANLAQKLVQSGVETPADITTMTETGNVDATGSKEYTIGVRITPADGEAYETTISQYLLPSAEFKAGGAVIVRVDPDDRTRALLWATR